MAADLLVYAIIAAALVFWLRSILGTKNGQERDRQNPFSPQNDGKNTKPAHLPDLDNAPTPLRDMTPGPVRVTKTMLMSRVRIETPAAQEGLNQIAARDSRFNMDRFMEGAEYAFELIVTSFAKGERATLQPLLSSGVYADFERAITDRETRGETMDTKIEAVRGMDIISATLNGNTAKISIRFTAQETCIIRNAAGMIIAGEPDKTTTMIDIWSFTRDISSTSPVWVLEETRDERPNPGPADPIPDAR